MLSIDESIAECKENDLCQIAEWLEELKEYKQKPEGWMWDEAERKGYNKAILDYRNMLCEYCMLQKNECNDLECPFHSGGSCDIVNMADKLISYKTRKCGECKRYGDLHSSCFKARFLEANPDDAACKDFK